MWDNLRSKSVIAQYTDELMFDHFMEKLVQSEVHTHLNSTHQQQVTAGTTKWWKLATTRDLKQKDVHHNLNKERKHSNRNLLRSMIVAVKSIHTYISVITIK